MKKKIILTCIIGSIITCLIYKYFKTDEMYILALGDGIALGETAYDIEGYSFNDYLKDYYEQESILKEYIHEFAEVEETTETLKMKINNNYTLESTNISIQQAISKSKILTLAIGMYELNNKKEITSKEINKYLKNMETILKVIRKWNDKKIIVLSLYPSKKIKKEKITEINEEIKKLCEKYQVNYINIENIIEKKDFFFDNKNYQLNYRGHRYISEKILESLE